MSGHSKWSKIKRQKTSKDIKKGSQFTKLGNAISVAAQEGGGDSESNVALRMAIDKAKQANMPNHTIERAIKKGMGELSEEKPLEQISYEAVGKNGISIIIDTLTDNKLRTISEIRHLLHQAEFSLSSGGARWQFSQKGSVTFVPKKEDALDSEKKRSRKEVYQDVDMDELMLMSMEIEGVEDVNRKILENGNSAIELITKRKSLSSVYKRLENMGIKVIRAELVKLPKTVLLVTKEDQKRVKALQKELLSLDDVVAVWCNIKL